MDIKFSKMDTLLELVSSLIINKISNRNLIPEVEVKKETQKTVERPKYIEQVIKLDLNESVIEDVPLPEEEVIVNDHIISDDEEYNSSTELMPEMYPVGLVHGTYIVLENENGMYLMDLHAAKERCNYERFKEAIGKPNIASTALLFPVTI